MQGQDEQCAAKANSVESLVAANKFDEAFEVWKSAQLCVSESLYRSGEKILIYNLSTNLPEADRAAQTAMLMRLYTDYDSKFPGNSNGNAVKKAMYLYRHDKNSAEVLPLFDRAFTKDSEHFTDANALQIYFELYNKQFTLADKAVTESALIEKADAITAHLEKLFSATGNNDYRMVSESIARITAPLLTCEKRAEFYEKQFDSKKSNADWLQTVTLGLAANCQRSAFYYKAASQWYALSQSPKAAFHLAQASTQQRKSADAMKYFAIAAENEIDPRQKAEIYYTMAMRQITDAPTAIGYLRQALKAKPDFGKAYLLLAEAYASTDCGKTAFEKKARYALAAQTALKAGQLDKGLKKTAEGQAAQYGKKAPTASEIKDAKMKGKTVTFACGIDESVTLPQ
jgi:tetratricopeptide (TPR) repeat protein